MQNKSIGKSIYFFQRKASDGSLLDDIFDCDERTAWDYYQNPRNFKYLGRSDGKIIRQFLKDLPKINRKNPKDFTKERKKTLIEVYNQEVEEAKKNPVPPRNPTKRYFLRRGGTSMRDVSSQEFSGGSRVPFMNG